MLNQFNHLETTLIDSTVKSTSRKVYRVDNAYRLDNARNTPVPCPMNDERGWERGCDFHKFVEYYLQILVQILILARVNHHRAEFSHKDDFIAMKLLDISILARVFWPIFCPKIGFLQFYPRKISPIILKLLLIDTKVKNTSSKVYLGSLAYRADNARKSLY